MTPVGALAAVLAVALVLALVQARHVRRVRADRGRLFDEVEGLFADARVHRDGLAFPVLTATYGGCPLRLQPVLDTLAYRRLPVLWLLVTHQRPLPVRAPLNALLRPDGSEFFSPNGGYDAELSACDGFPAHLRIASPAPQEAPAPEALRRCQPFLSDPRAKELHVAGTGVRLVWRLAEAGQAHYRTTRRADLGSVRVKPAQLRFLLDTLADLGETVAVPAAREA